MILQFSLSQTTTNWWAREEDPFSSFLSLSPHATAARVGGGVEEGGKETPVAFVRFLEEEQGG